MPKSGDFDNVEPDSCDEDFEHEFEELCGRQDSDKNQSVLFGHLNEPSSLKGQDPIRDSMHQVSGGKNSDNLSVPIQPQS